MELMRSINRLVLLPILLAALALSSCSVEAFRGHRLAPSRQFSHSEPPSALESDSDLLHALEFLEQYERAKTREPSNNLQAIPELYGVVEEPEVVEPYQRYGNEIPFSLDNDIPYQKWDDDDEVLNDVDLEDLYKPRPEDLETNEVAFAEAILDEYKEYETRRQRDLFNKILGDVMAEKILQQDEEENIARLMEEEDDEEEGLNDLAAIFDSSSSTGSSEPDTAVYEPQEFELPMFSASSSSDEPLDEDSQSSEGIDADDFFVSEAGLEVLGEAERILKEGYAAEEEAESSETMSDFDDTFDGDSQFSETGDLTQEEKEETLKDVIYRIVQDTLRKKLVESMVGSEDTGPDMSMESSIVEIGDSGEEEESDANEPDGKYGNLLDNLVGEIRDQVDQLASKIMKEIEEGDSDEDDDDNDDEDQNESSDGYFNELPINDESSSIPEEVIDEIMAEGAMSFVVDPDSGTSSSSIGEVNDEDMMSDDELINAIKEIVPAAESKVCPILAYLVDDCTVIEGFRGLGADGYKQAFSRPCNRHQICYTCSTSYEIPTKLCDEIYKAELLTLCNGDLACMQRAKYFWLAATSDRTAPDVSLSLCSDRCVLDFLLSD